MKFAATVAALFAVAPSVSAWCETAYGKDGPDGKSNTQCFSNDVWGSYKTPRWGWVLNDISSGGESFPVYAGAAQCDSTKGTQVGTVTVSYSGGVCSATFTALSSEFSIEEMHLYCSNEPVPPNGFTANGQFPSVSSGLSASTYTATTPLVGGLSVTGQPSGPVYAIVHFVACGGGGEGEGDPHFKTWSGKWFDYMGQCDLKMMEAKQFDGHQDLAINVRTTVQYDYSYIEAAAIQIGNDVLEVGSWGDYAVNGVDTPYMGGKAGHIGGYPVVHTQVNKKKHTFDIMLGHNKNITLASYKHLVSVKMDVGAEVGSVFANSKGLIGSHSGDLLARDGKTIMEADEAFGQEWQVTDEEAMLFRTARAPQYPEKCVMPQPSSTQRRLGESIAEEAAQKACAHKTGAAFKNCVYDVMAIGDLELAEAGAM